MMEIDPIRYGVMYQKVEDYDRRLAEFSSKMDKLEGQMTELLAAVNQIKGGAITGKIIIGSISAGLIALIDWFIRK